MHEPTSFLNGHSVANLNKRNILMGILCHMLQGDLLLQSILPKALGRESLKGR